MKLLSRSLPATLLMAVALGGCGGAADHGSAPEASAPSATTSPTHAADTSIPTGYDESADASADLAAAFTASKRDDKPVLIDFGADWCPDCVVLDHLYQVPAVAGALRSGFHLVLVDVGQFDTNLDVVRRYTSLHRTGIPALVVVEPGGRVAYSSNHGEFANARSMTDQQLLRFLRHWAAV